MNNYNGFIKDYDFINVPSITLLTYARKEIKSSKGQIARENSTYI